MRGACRDDACRIEVDEPHGHRCAVPPHEHMRRLDVAVHDAERMQGTEPVRKRKAQRPRLGLC